ncbi:MAG: hypothetical protein MAG458_01394 [Nitrosopumilus sp.]|nr:hypothetical protein [Nitrosopumilus sp.]
MYGKNYVHEILNVLVDIKEQTILEKITLGVTDTFYNLRQSIKSRYANLTHVGVQVKK